MSSDFYQYKVIVVSKKDLEEELNKQGQEGYKVIKVMQKDALHLRVVMSRHSNTPYQIK